MFTISITKLLVAEETIPVLVLVAIFGCLHAIASAPLAVHTNKKTRLDFLKFMITCHDLPVCVFVCTQTTATKTATTISIILANGYQRGFLKVSARANSTVTMFAGNAIQCQDWIVTYIATWTLCSWAKDTLLFGSTKDVNIPILASGLTTEFAFAITNHVV